jgi:hypothetical protein
MLKSLPQLTSTKEPKMRSLSLRKSTLCPNLGRHRASNLKPRLTRGAGSIIILIYRSNNSPPSKPTVGRCGVSADSSKNFPISQSPCRNSQNCKPQEEATYNRAPCQLCPMMLFVAPNSKWQQTSCQIKIRREGMAP